MKGAITEKKITIKYDEKLYRIIREKLPWLEYNNIEDFANEAVKKWTLDLLQVALS